MPKPVPKPLKVPSLARSVPKPLKVSSLARSVPKPLKVPSLALSVPKPLSIFAVDLLLSWSSLREVRVYDSQKSIVSEVKSEK